MVDKKEKEEDKDVDIFDYLGLGWGFSNPFPDFGELFKYIIREVMEEHESEPEEWISRVYGFNFRVGPDGKPHFQEFGNLPTRPGLTKDTREPLVDVVDGKETISVTAEMPGITKEDIELKFEDATLTIKVDNENRKYYKEIPLSADVDAKSVKATYNNGILDIEFKKKQQKKSSTKIKIE